MNQHLYNHLEKLGFTEPDLDDRIKAYLLFAITAAGGTPSADSSNDDLWTQLGSQLGMAATTVNEIQVSWAILQGTSSSGVNWNDAMQGLPQ